MSSKSPRKSELQEGETSLTSAECASVKEILAKELGNRVAFYNICRSTDFKSGVPCIKGSCYVETAYCPHRSQGKQNPYTHHSNRMKFQIEDGVKSFFCFAKDCRSVYLAWKTDDTARKLIDPTWEPEVVVEEQKEEESDASPMSGVTLTAFGTGCW